MLVELLLALMLTQQPKVLICTVLKPDKVIACPTQGNPDSTTLWLIENWHPDLVDEWRWVAQYDRSPAGGGQLLAVNLPLEKESLKAGQQVRAALDKDGHLIPIARCDVRVHRQVNKYLEHGDRPPLSAWTPPDDCTN